MNTSKHVIIIIFCITLLGCGTFLSVGETTVKNFKPRGVTVNKRAIYKAEVTLLSATGDKAELLSDSGHSLSDSGDPVFKSTTVVSGIDSNNVLVINGTRMPFSSGHLKLTVSEEQLTTEVGITSETGAVRAAQAASTVVETANQ